MWCMTTASHNRLVYASALSNSASTTASIPILFKVWIKAFEFNPDISSSKTPIDFIGFLVAFMIPRSCFFAHLLYDCNPCRYSLVVNYLEFYLGHIKPTPVFRRIRYFKLVLQPFRFFCRKGFIYRRNALGIQIIHHQNDFPGKSCICSTQSGVRCSVISTLSSLPKGRQT
ncbi:hypothetical protein Holit_00953 [Hollandina sp. SP2]